MDCMPQTFVRNFHNFEEIKQMKYNSFKGEMISKIGIGGAAFGGAATYGEYDVKNGKETILEALKSGINYIDTAPFYGHGRSEKYLGSILSEIPRKSFYISTKACRYGANKFDFSKSSVLSSVNSSLLNLQLDYIDMLVIHDIEFAENSDIISKEAIPAARQCVQEGKVKYIGVSGYPLNKLMEIIEASGEQIDFILTYCRDTLFDNSLQACLPFFQKNGVEVINAGCLGMGLLTNSGPQNWHPAKEETKLLCKEAASFCEKSGVELGRLALYHSLRQPGSATCLVGMNNTATLRENLNILRDGLTENESRVLREIQKIYFPLGKIHHWEGVELESYKNLQQSAD